jgi:hypothetical protein
MGESESNLRGCVATLTVVFDNNDLSYPIAYITN